MKLLVFAFLISIMFMSCTNQHNQKPDSAIDVSDTLQLKTVILSVEGMTCEGCENTIQNTVQKIDGIRQISASHVKSQATVVYDTSITSIVLISEAISNLGYAVKGEVADSLK